MYITQVVEDFFFLTQSSVKILTFVFKFTKLSRQAYNPDLNGGPYHFLYRETSIKSNPLLSYTVCKRDFWLYASPMSNTFPEAL